MTIDTQPKTILRNAFNKETFIFSRQTNPAVATMDVILEEGGSGGGNALVHVHPLADETFRLKSGRLRVVVDGEENLVSAGQSFTIPKGRPHFFENAHKGASEFTVEFSPAQHFNAFFQNFPRLTEKHPNWFSAKGDPKLLLIALTMETYPDHLYLSKPPVLVQKILFKLLAPIARMMGYKMEVFPSQK